MAATTKVSLKLLVDSKGHRVLFAEAGKEFIDFLFTIFSLPLGTVVGLITKQSMVGCLGKLYESLENLNETYMQPNANKDNLLIPKLASNGAESSAAATEPPLLLPNVSVSSTTKEFSRCGSGNSSCFGYVTDDPRAICPYCKGCMSKKLTYVAPPAANQAASSGEGGGYVKGLVTYMVMDDLSVQPMSTISGIAMLNKFNVKEVGALEEKVVYLSVDEWHSDDPSFTLSHSSTGGMCGPRRWYSDLNRL